ncbi:hypothetical protein [Paenibacillus sp. USHLN196]|uniref:hypothetical protein n=1 Tax=Paenibacillus sp. USHLN196 TaxID=3081291 RepID=UPI00301A81B3
MVEIGVKNHDIQALLLAHRIVHDVDAFVINRPSEGEYGAARSADKAKLEEIAAYIEKNTDGTARP